jgi:hypothetical protein
MQGTGIFVFYFLQMAALFQENSSTIFIHSIFLNFFLSYCTVINRLGEERH